MRGGEGLQGAARGCKGCSVSRAHPAASARLIEVSLSRHLPLPVGSASNTLSRLSSLSNISGWSYTT